MGYLASAGGQKLITDALGGLVMGIGYTSGAYTGYGISNTIDPIGIHTQAKSYNRPQYVQIEQGMSYGSYGRRSYGRYSRYRGYRRRSYYRRRRPYYRRSYRRSYY